MTKGTPSEESEFPMRLNKYLAHTGVATRRAADELIAKRKVLLNGEVAVLGDKVHEGDKVELVKNTARKQYVYFAFNKPRGVITHSPQLGEKDVKQSIPKTKEMRDLFPIGRLDKDSRGLLLLTNDGRLTDRLLNPDRDHEKEYRVWTQDPLRESFKKLMEAGVDIEGYRTRPCTIRKTGENTFNITLTEGKKHQIRRMVAALHNTVTDLERVRILNVKLGNLKPGALRPINGEELSILLTKLGLTMQEK